MAYFLNKGVLILIIAIGALVYLAAAGVAIIYCLGGSSTHKARRGFFGILGAIMIYAFICFCIYVRKSGWPL